MQSLWYTSKMVVKKTNTHRLVNVHQSHRQWYRDGAALPFALDDVLGH